MVLIFGLVDGRKDGDIPGSGEGFIRPQTQLCHESTSRSFRR